VNDPLDVVGLGVLYNGKLVGVGTVYEGCLEGVVSFDAGALYDGAGLFCVAGVTALLTQNLPLPIAGYEMQ
jgi:hypothetical protein